MNTYTDFPNKPDNGYGFIYFLRSPSGKCYIGQTTQAVTQRLRCHCYSGCRYLYKAIKKYGITNFFVDVLGRYPITELDAAEVKAIIEFGTLAPYGYNLTTGGNANHKCSDQTRKRMAEAQKGKPKSAEARQRMSEARAGKPLSAEVKQKISVVKTGTKYNMVVSKRGIPLSAETKMRMSLSKIGKPCTEEHKRLMREGWRLRRLRKQDALPLFQSGSNTDDSLLAKT